MRYRVEHFKPEEFLCPCCKRGGVSRLLALWLDLLRRSRSPRRFGTEELELTFRRKNGYCQTKRSLIKSFFVTRGVFISSLVRRKAGVAQG